MFKLSKQFTLVTLILISTITLAKIYFQDSSPVYKHNTALTCDPESMLAMAKKLPLSSLDRYLIEILPSIGTAKASLLIKNISNLNYSNDNLALAIQNIPGFGKKSAAQLMRFIAKEPKSICYRKHLAYYIDKY